MRFDDDYDQADWDQWQVELGDHIAEQAAREDEVADR